MYIITTDLGAVYSEDDFLKGKCPNAGTRGLVPNASGTGSKEYVMVKIAASQNLVKGKVVTIDASYVATVIAAGAPAKSARDRLGVMVCTVTASVSLFAWAQIWGNGEVLASTAADANIVLTGAATAGNVDDAVSTLSAVIYGIHLTASAGGAPALTACVLNYPGWDSLS